MFYSFERLMTDGAEEYWQPITLANIHQVEGFFSIPCTIRNFKEWGNDEN